VQFDPAYIVLLSSHSPFITLEKITKLYEGS